MARLFLFSFMRREEKQSVCWFSGNIAFHSPGQHHILKLLPQTVGNGGIKPQGDAHAVTSVRSVQILGYGAKAFTISMVETALQISNGKIAADIIRQIVDLGKSLLKMPIELPTTG